MRLDAEGAPDASLGFWAVSEGNGGTLADQLIQLDAAAAVVQIVLLPPAVRAELIIAIKPALQAPLINAASDVHSTIAGE